MRDQTRREFLCRTIPAAVATGTALTFGPFRNALAAQLPPAGPGRGYTAGKYALEMDGQFAGWIESAVGGHATSDVVSKNLGPDNIQRKHIANIKYEDISVNCGTGMSKGFYDWIKSSFDKQYLRKSGAVITMDYNDKERSRLDWTSALLSEVAFPALDAASKDAAKMTVKFSPEITRQQALPAGGAAYTAAGYKSGQTVQKKWLPSNFRLQIAGMEAACTRVNRIEAITLRFANAQLPLGASRAIEGVPPRFQASNLVVTLPEQDAMPFYNWYRDVVTKGNNVSNEKEGLLAYLTPDLRESIFVLGLHGLSLFKLTPQKVQAGSESIRRVQAEFSCKDMTFSPAAAAWA